LLRSRRLALGAIAICGALAAAAATTEAAPAHPYTCSGGVIPAGSYGSVLVTGVCSVPSGTVDIHGGLTVAPGALLDAVSPASGGTGSALPGTVNVDGGIRVGAGAMLGLGCGPSVCNPPLGSTDDTVNGGIVALGALAVIVHSTTINGGVSILGGGGGPAVEGVPASGECFGLTPPAPWTEDANLTGLPPYSDLEGNTINGGMIVVGLRSCWFGALRNTVHGDVFVADNSMGDPDANEVVNNTVYGSLGCFLNDVPVQYGDSGATPNEVAGVGFGECGFGVLSPDPNFGTGGSQPVSVPLR
jgi:hypothetical protein